MTKGMCVKEAFFSEMDVATQTPVLEGVSCFEGKIFFFDF